MSLEIQKENDLFHFTQISEESEESSEKNHVDHSTLSISQFIDDFGDSLIHAVRLQNPPVFHQDTVNARRAGLLSGLKRVPFPAQATTIQAVTTLLIDKDEKAAIINAEMGTGKTLMGIATGTLLHQEGFKRTLILSPPHLVYKWRREIFDTVPEAEVVVLNGSDTLKKLQALSQQVRTPVTVPTFYIIGRVRLRMGHHWRPSVLGRRFKGETTYGDGKAFHSSISIGQLLASCPHCGEFVKSNCGDPILLERISFKKKEACWHCRLPLWTLVHKRKPDNAIQALKQSLCKLPGIGEKMAERLIDQFGETLLTQSLSDNLHQLIHLMDEKGQFVFSDRQAKRLERALSRADIELSQASYQASEYIKRYLPKGFFSLLIVDEGHEYKNAGSAQGQAMSVLCAQVNKVLLLTGTLMGGYADDLFYLLWRLLPHRMMEDGYRYNQHGSLSSSAMSFMEMHGILKKVYKSSDRNDHLTAKGKREITQISKAPGFGPLGIVHFLLPYTAFLKLSDLEQKVLPEYREHLINVTLTKDQETQYKGLEIRLKETLRKALSSGDHSLLGVVLNCLLAWPDCCFREELVMHPRTQVKLAYIESVLGDEASPKEAEMIRLCLEAKKASRRTLLYSIYTGKRDTTGRLNRSFALC